MNAPLPRVHCYRCGVTYADVATCRICNAQGGPHTPPPEPKTDAAPRPPREGKVDRRG